MEHPARGCGARKGDGAAMLVDVVKEYGGEPVTPLDVYADVFKFGEGYIQKNRDDHRQVANHV